MAPTRIAAVTACTPRTLAPGCCSATWCVRARRRAPCPCCVAHRAPSRERSSSSSTSSSRRTSAASPSGAPRRRMPARRRSEEVDAADGGLRWWQRLHAQRERSAPLFTCCDVTSWSLVTVSSSCDACVCRSLLQPPPPAVGRVAPRARWFCSCARCARSWAWRNKLHMRGVEPARRWRRSAACWAACSARCASRAWCCESCWARCSSHHTARAPRAVAGLRSPRAAFRRRATAPRRATRWTCTSQPRVRAARLSWCSSTAVRAAAAGDVRQAARA